MQDEEKPTQPSGTPTQQPSGKPTTQPTGAPTAEAVVSAESREFRARVKSTQLKMKPRITIVGAVQAVRMSYPDANPKEGGFGTGGMIGHFFAEKYKSTKSSANEVASEVGKGAHKYGDHLTLGSERRRLHPNEEPAYVDSGESVSKAPGDAFAIGNDKYEEDKGRQGLYGPPIEKLDTCISDAKKVEKVLKNKNFSTKNSPYLDKRGQEMKTLVNEAISSLKSDSSLVFYYSGHATIEGLIGTDGKVLAPADLEPMVKKAIEVKSDLVILLDACHAGIMVDRCRFTLLERAKNHNKNKDKIKAFIDAAIDLAKAKEKFMQGPVLELWKKTWQAQYLDKFKKPKEAKDKAEITKLNAEYRSARAWFKAWNDFVDATKTKINETVQKGQAAGISVKSLKLDPFTDKDITRADKRFGGDIDQDQEYKIQAQLDDLDEILNLAASAGS